MPTSTDLQARLAELDRLRREALSQRERQMVELAGDVATRQQVTQAWGETFDSLRDQYQSLAREVQRTLRAELESLPKPPPTEPLPSSKESEALMAIGNECVERIRNLSALQHPEFYDQPRTHVIHVDEEHPDG